MNFDLLIPKKSAERLITLKGECSCLPNCNDVNYVTDEVDSRMWFLGSNLQWGLKEYPSMRLKRDVIFGFTDLLGKYGLFLFFLQFFNVFCLVFSVYIGGMTGLFLGCSVLSFIEILYFFSIKFYWFAVNYKKNNNLRRL